MKQISFYSAGEYFLVQILPWIILFLPPVIALFIVGIDSSEKFLSVSLILYILLFGILWLIEIFMEQKSRQDSASAICVNVIDDAIYVSDNLGNITATAYPFSQLCAVLFEDTGTKLQVSFLYPRTRTWVRSKKAESFFCHPRQAKTLIRDLAATGCWQLAELDGLDKHNQVLLVKNRKEEM